MTSAHTHIETVLNGSTLENMVAKAQSLGRKYFTYTDFAYFVSALKAYDLVSKKGMKPILGVEVFFKDPTCEVINLSNASNAKYFKTTLYATNQEQYRILGELSSEASHKIKFFGDQYPAWNWKMLEIAAKAGCLIGSSDIHDIVSKHIIMNSPEAAEQIFLRIQSLFKENTYLTIVGVNQSRRFVQFVEVVLDSRTTILIPATEKVQTDAGRSVSAMELVDAPNKHFTLINTFVGKFVKNYNQKITSAKVKKGYIKLKEGDIQFCANKGILQIAAKYNIPLLYSDYACYSDPEDKAAQDVKLSSDARREYCDRHMQSDNEMAVYLASLGLNELEIDQIRENQTKWAARFDGFTLKYDYRLPAIEGSSMAIIADTIKKVGRLPLDNPIYVDRLRYELDVLSKNGQIDLLPYFIPLIDIYRKASEVGTITGAARGSAAGSLLAFLIGITHVDPIQYNLSFERFFSLDRALAKNLPDIDCDFSNRDFLVGDDGYLKTKYGDKFSQVSTKSLLRLKSAIKDVNRYINGKVEMEIELLTKALPSAPQGVADSDFVFGYTNDDGDQVIGLLESSDDLKKYIQKRPKEWELVVACLGLSRSSSVHASAFLIADIPIKSAAPMLENGATQYEAKYCEKAGLVKYDFLVVNQEKDIEDCLKRINKKVGIDLPTMYFDHKGKKTFIWDLPKEPNVFESIWDGKYEAIFQISTGAMRPFVQAIKPSSIEDLGLILALVRPGCLDAIDEKTNRNMAEEYVERRFGRSTPSLDILGELLPETSGTLIYQEQVQYISSKLGGLSGNDAEKLRRAMSKKQKIEVGQFKKIFMEGAQKKVPLRVAEQVWDQMEASSRYSFNKSHAISYAFTTYACMFLCYHYPLEWWASVLSNADEKEFTNVLYKHVKHFILPPDINLSTEQMEIDYSNNKIRSKFSTLKGLGGKSVEKLVEGRPYKDILDFVQKEGAGSSLAKKLIHVGILDSIFPPHMSAYQKMQSYEDAVEQVKYDAKIAAGKKASKKQGVVDSDYVGINPIQDFCIRKSIMPTVSLDLSSLIVEEAVRMNEGCDGKPLYADSGGFAVPYIRGENLKRLESMEHTEQKEYCFTGYVIKMEEKPYHQNTRKRLILTLDIDGEISEKILWPDYDSGVLWYPDNLKKGAIAFFFSKIKPGKQPSLYDVVLEAAPLAKTQKGAKV